MSKATLILVLIVSLLSCSKKEHIPFIPSLVDSLTPNYYHNLQGSYKGEISKIYIPPQNNPREIIFDFIGPPLNQELTVVDINFSHIDIDDVSRLEDKGAECFIQRVDSMAYLKFDPVTMDDHLRPIYVFYLDYGSHIDSFNGRWNLNDGNIHYFVRWNSGSGNVDYFFEGNRL